MKFVLLLLIITTFTGCVSASQIGAEDNENRFLSMDEKSIEQCLTIKNDDYEQNIQINSQNCYQAKHGLLGIVWEDQFIRAFKNKKTKSITFQIYTKLVNSDWMMPYAVNYRVGKQLKTVSGTRVGSDVKCTSMGCTHYEDFVFNIDDKDIEKIIQFSNQNKNSVSWQYRIKSQSGIDRDKNFNIAELIGAYKKIKEIK